MEQEEMEEFYRAFPDRIYRTEYTSNGKTGVVFITPAYKNNKLFFIDNQQVNLTTTEEQELNNICIK